MNDDKKIKYKSYNPSLRDLARKNRLSSPEPELKIWQQVLRRQKTGYKFLRQKPINNFIVDFYCAKLLLAIEVDGDSHYANDQINADHNRSINLADEGIKVIRYTNSEVMKNINGVFEDVLEQIKIRENELNLTP